MENKVLIGTSGWGYEECFGPFYPKGLTSKDLILFRWKCKINFKIAKYYEFLSMK